MEWEPRLQVDPRFVGELGRFPVPKNRLKNLETRVKILQEADGCKSTQAVLWDRCARDLLFWLNMFGWTKNPRSMGEKVLPFITYPFQDKALKIMVARIRGQEDLLIEKSRDMGASWMLISVFTWFWMFDRDCDFLLISRNESLVDKKGNPKSLFWKILFLVERLPPWMQPRFEHTLLKLVNFDQASTITGESTNKNAGRGDRVTAIGLDEAAAMDNLPSVMDSVPDTTDCCFLNSTPRGEGTEFFKIREQRPDIVLSLHWPLHPIKSRGLYRLTESGGVDFIDKTYAFPADYPWPVRDENLLGGLLRSPWYDKMCVRMGSARRVAQELDIDHGAAGGQAFDARNIESLIACAKPPFHLGDLEYDKETGEMVGWMPSDLGQMRLWLPLDPANKPYEDKYVVSADVSAGTGASNSALTVARENTGEKVAGFASSRIQPQDFGAMAVAICRWFHGAYLIWDRGGAVGRVFGQAVENCGYTHVYVQRAEERRNKKRTDIPGFHPCRKTKTVLLLSYAAALQNGAFTNPDKVALQECLKFIRVKDFVTHSEEKTTNDPAGAGSNHGDRAFADALAWHICRKNRPKKVVVKEKTLDMFTHGGRFQAAERAKKTQGQGMVWLCQKGR